jgi:hypothetical protein
MQRRFEIMTPQPPDAVIPFDLEMVMDNGETHTERRHVSFLTSPRVAASPEIDGDLSDWTGGDPIRLNSQEQIDHQSEPWDGPEDSSALVWTAWSDDWLFIAAEVRDDIMSDPSEGFAVYNNDGIEVYLDTELARDQARTRYSADDHQIGLFNQRGAAVVYHLTRQAEIASAEIVINRMPTPSQTRSRNRCDYIIEAAIPTAAIDLTPEAGTPIGFNVALIDDDDPTSVHPFGQEIHMVWTGLRNSWRNPRQFGQLTLTEPARE